LVADVVSWILHISDPHLGDVPSKLDDDKAVIKDQPDLETSQKVFLRTFKTIVQFVEENGKPAIVVLSGDLTYRNRDSGFKVFTKLLAERAAIFPDDPSRIVVVPGNHDVDWEEKPASGARYSRFLAVTRDVGCTTPLLDGIDFDPETAALKPEAKDHPHVAITEGILAIALNSSNFCGVPVTPRDGWTVDEWESELDTRGLGADTELVAQLKKLHQQDIARISKPQVEALAAYFGQTAGLDTSPVGDERLRIAVLHHQLLPLSLREERKAFESLISLQMLRELLRDYGVRIVLHGHKHESGLYWHSVGCDDDLAAPPHRMMVVSSPGRFEVKAPTMRAIMLGASPRARNVRILTFGGAAPSARKHPDVIDDQTVGVWQAEMEGEERAPTVITAANTHSAYARVCSLFALEGEHTRPNVIVEIDDPSDAARLPPDYPEVPGADRDQWLTELVDWWQLERSELVGEKLAPFNHGERIHARWGDQVNRAVLSLNEREDSSRALVLLMAPRETGRYPADERDSQTGSYPALVLAEFVVAERAGTRMLDCCAYFRVQEMQYWWTVNVAELALLQEEVRGRMKIPPATGRIVTYGAIAHWKAKLPRVAVPTVDLLVEDGDRLSDLAFAVAYPDSATDLARADWARVLADLTGEGRAEPPRPRVGAQRLRDEIDRLAAAVSNPKLRAVAMALQALCGQYAAFDAVTLNAAAAEQIRGHVRTLAETVQSALANAEP
jgi:3',5'-cyclic AMP phosphodiesterase CpdA